MNFVADFFKSSIRETDRLKGIQKGFRDYENEKDDEMEQDNSDQEEPAWKTNALAR